MNLPLSILIVDDHPAMIEGYRSILGTKYSTEEIKITEAYNCEIAYQYITNSIVAFDLVLLDLVLPPFESAKLFSGEDLARVVRKISQKTKIMLLTSHTGGFVLYNLIKKINPEGVLIKSDFKSDEFLKAIVDVLNGEIYYTITAKRSIKDVGINNNALDSFDRRIISLLAKGIKTKNIPEHIGLSISAIDKRKAIIKLFFGFQKGNDEDIINEAKNRGLI